MELMHIWFAHDKHNWSACQLFFIHHCTHVGFLCFWWLVVLLMWHMTIQSTHTTVSLFSPDSFHVIVSTEQHWHGEKLEWKSSMCCGGGLMVPFIAVASFFSSMKMLALYQLVYISLDLCTHIHSHMKDFFSVPLRVHWICCQLVLRFKLLVFRLPCILLYWSPQEKICSPQVPQ